MPTPEQIQAALPAMRWWLLTHAANRYTVEASANAEDSLIVAAIERFRAGGVAQFIADQEERRG